MSPFQNTVPSKSTSIVITWGGSVGGGGLPCGMFRLTACNWIGIVMISMTSSTSITSISGVVLMSIITSGSSEPPPGPTLIAIGFSLSQRARSAVARRRFSDEPDLLDSGALACEHDAAHEFITSAQIAADLDLGLRLEH